MIHAENLSKYYNDFCAVDKINFDIQIEYLKTQTAMILVCVAFVLGLFSSAILTIMKDLKYAST